MLREPKPFTACPKCKSQSLDYTTDMDGEFIWQLVKCKCGFSWNEVYSFWRCETADTTEEIDENGNVIE